MRKTRMLIGVMVTIAFTVITSTACMTPTAQPEPATTPVPQVEDTPTAPTAEPTTVVEPQAALVNGEAILLADYERQVARYEASMAAAGYDFSTAEGRELLEQGRAWVLELMIEQLLVSQAAAREGITVSDEEVDATIASLRDEIGEEAFQGWLANENMPLEEMRERLRSDMIAMDMANRIADRVPTRAEHVHARHILLGTEEEARSVLSQLQAGGDFAVLAGLHSYDISTRDAGGDLGFFPLGVLTSEEVEQAAFALQPGQISDVIQSPLGYHIIQVVERIPDMEISAENMRLLHDRAVRDWIEELRAAAQIERLVSITP